MMVAREDICFILVRTQFASNLGSTVRVMANMGFRELILVRPECEVGMEARSYAMKGAETLDRARLIPSLEKAAREVGILVGTTGRFKGDKSKLISCPDLVDEVISKATGSKIGIVIGSEDNGLRREELRLCHWLVEIPTGSDYPVINLAQAAAIVAYQLNLGFLSRSSRKTLRPADPEELRSLLERIERTIQKLEPATRLSGQRLLLRLKKIIGRAQLEKDDVKMLHGLLKEVEKKLA